MELMGFLLNELAKTKSSRDWTGICREYDTIYNERDRLVYWSKLVEERRPKEGKKPRIDRDELFFLWGRHSEEPLIRVCFANIEPDLHRALEPEAADGEWWSERAIFKCLFEKYRNFVRASSNEDSDTGKILEETLFSAWALVRQVLPNLEMFGKRVLNQELGDFQAHLAEGIIPAGFSVESSEVWSEMEAAPLDDGSSRLQLRFFWSTMGFYSRYASLGVDELLSEGRRRSLAEMKKPFSTICPDQDLRLLLIHWASFNPSWKSILSNRCDFTFVDRSDMPAVVHKAPQLLDHHVALIGTRQVGKTSFLKKLENGSGSAARLRCFNDDATEDERYVTSIRNWEPGQGDSPGTELSQTFRLQVHDPAAGQPRLVAFDAAGELLHSKYGGGEQYQRLIQRLPPAAVIVLLDGSADDTGAREQCDGLSACVAEHGGVLRDVSSESVHFYVLFSKADQAAVLPRRLYQDLTTNAEQFASMELRLSKFFKPEDIAKWNSGTACQIIEQRLERDDAFARKPGLLKAYLRCLGKFFAAEGNSLLTLVQQFPNATFSFFSAVDEAPLLHKGIWADCRERVVNSAADARVMAFEKRFISDVAKRVEWLEALSKLGYRLRGLISMSTNVPARWRSAQEQITEDSLQFSNYSDAVAKQKIEHAWHSLDLVARTIINLNKGAHDHVSAGDNKVFDPIEFFKERDIVWQLLEALGIPPDQQPAIPLDSGSLERGWDSLEYGGVRFDFSHARGAQHTLCALVDRKLSDDERKVLATPEIGHGWYGLFTQRIREAAEDAGVEVAPDKLLVALRLVANLHQASPDQDQPLFPGFALRRGSLDFHQYRVLQQREGFQRLFAKVIMEVAEIMRVLQSLIGITDLASRLKVLWLAQMLRARKFSRTAITHSYLSGTLPQRMTEWWRVLPAERVIALWYRKLGVSETQFQEYITSGEGQPAAAWQRLGENLVTFSAAALRCLLWSELTYLKESNWFPNANGDILALAKLAESHGSPINVYRGDIFEEGIARPYVKLVEELNMQVNTTKSAGNCDRARRATMGG